MIFSPHGTVIFSPSPYVNSFQHSELTPVQSLDELQKPALGVGAAGMQLEFASIIAGGGLDRLQWQR